jgi:anion-transporting  ArsA/GET3 family ATPase
MANMQMIASDGKSALLLYAGYDYVVFDAAP